MPPGLSDLLDSDVDATNYVDENSLISSVSDETQTAQSRAAGTKIKRAKKRKCVTMPKRRPAARLSLDVSNEKATKIASRKRKAVEQDFDEDSIIEAQLHAPQRKLVGIDGRDIHPKPRGRPKMRKPTSIEGDEEDQEEEEVLEAAQSNFAHTKASKSLPKPVVATKKVTSVVAVSSKKSARLAPARIEDEEDTEEAMQPVSMSSPPRKKVRTDVKAHAPELAELRRAGSTSETAKNDPELRRRLGDITRKCENIDLKYRNLKSTGIHEATNNVEKLRKQCENITEASNRLVTSLKKELAAQAPMIAEAKKHEKRAYAYEEEARKLKMENKEMALQLATAQNEIKALQVKLTAAKAAAECKVPMSQHKTAPIPKAVVVASGSEAAQLAQLKVDLYADLTGLIVRSVKKTDDGDTYDCIQTGRNGTLHFKLSIDADEAKTSSFEETEFVYTPLLDENRDKELIDLMPAYLIDDITFARANAAKFYQRVQDTLTKKIDIANETG